MTIIIVHRMSGMQNSLLDFAMRKTDMIAGFLGRVTMMLSSRAAVTGTFLPTPGQSRNLEAPRGLLQRLLGGPNSFPESKRLLLNNRMQAAHWPARTDLLHFF
jgi:hypothetical protein